MKSPQSKMWVLILGGTNFVGRADAIEAIARGHDVTTFNRGTKPTPEGSKAIVSDRLSPDGYKGLDGSDLRHCPRRLELRPHGCPHCGFAFPTTYIYPPSASTTRTVSCPRSQKSHQSSTPEISFQICCR